MCILAALALIPGASPPAALPGDFVRAMTFIPCGDANGDGIGDLAIGLPRDDAHGKDAGRVFVLSGKDGTVIRELHEGGPLSGFGFALAGGADFDGDGKPDLAIAAHRDGFGDSVPQGAKERPGRVHVYSLTSGALIRTIEPPEQLGLGPSYASVLHAVGDLDRDGGEDLLVGSRAEADVRGGFRSPMTLVSGKTGKLSKSIAFNTEAPPFVIGEVDHSGPRVLALRVDDGFRLVSLATQEPIASEPLGFGGFRPRTLVDLGDLDGDHVAEIAALGKRGQLERCENVFVLSWPKDKKLFDVRGDALRREAGIEASSSGNFLDACGAPDLDGDGCGEIFVVIPGAWRSLTQAEWTRLHPGIAYPLGACVHGFGTLVSSKTGQPLWSTVGTELMPLGTPVFDWGYGEELMRVGDFDHDGLDDLGVAVWDASTSEPYEKNGASLQVLSSKDGAQLISIVARPGADPLVELAARVHGASKPK